MAPVAPYYHAYQRLNHNNETRDNTGLGGLTSATGPIRRRLTPSEMDQRKKDGLCYFCDDKYVPGHRCKRLYRMELVADHDQDDDDQEGEASDGEHSLHVCKDHRGVRP